jgi:hypothetical protein
MLLCRDTHFMGRWQTRGKPHLKSPRIKAGSSRWEANPSHPKYDTHRVRKLWRQSVVFRDGSLTTDQMCDLITDILILMLYQLLKLCNLGRVVRNVTMNTRFRFPFWYWTKGLTATTALLSLDFWSINSVQVTCNSDEKFYEIRTSSIEPYHNEFRIPCTLTGRGK